MNCPFTDEYLALYLTNDLDRKTSTAIAQHLVSCETCRSTLDNLRLTTDLLSQFEGEDNEQNLANNVLSAIAANPPVTSYAPFRLIGAALVSAALLVIFNSMIPRHVAKPSFNNTPVQTVYMTVAPAYVSHKLPNLRLASPLRRHLPAPPVSAGIVKAELATTHEGQLQLKIATADPNVLILLPANGHTDVN